MGLWYSKDTDMSLTAYSHSDHAGCQDTRRSTSGSTQFLGDKLVSWFPEAKSNCDLVSEGMNIFLIWKSRRFNPEETWDLKINHKFRGGLLGINLHKS
ncbi:uncharacterized mitochondrial protein-like protein [Tanacetum coccineum]